MDVDKEDAISSMASSCADVQRWLLQGAVQGGKFSKDRITNIKYAAQRLIELADKLGE